MFSSKKNVRNKKSPKEVFRNTTPKPKIGINRHGRMVLLGLLGAVVIGSLIGLSVFRDDTGGAPEIERADRVAYPVSRFADGKAHHFEYVSDDMTIRYFILRTSGGGLRAAFDACDVCWPENKGYAQDGDSMICRNCGRKFASERIGLVQGGCNPAPLKWRQDGEDMVIDITDILSGRKYFDFTGREEI